MVSYRVTQVFRDNRAHVLQMVQPYSHVGNPVGSCQVITFEEPRLQNYFKCYHLPLRFLVFYLNENNFFNISSGYFKVGFKDELCVFGLWQKTQTINTTEKKECWKMNWTPTHCASLMKRLKQVWDDNKVAQTVSWFLLEIEFCDRKLHCFALLCSKRCLGSAMSKFIGYHIL